MIRRPPRSTQSRSSAASDVYKRQEFGKIEIDSKTLKLYCFNMILGYSRMRYIEFTLSIDVYTLIQCHLNAFRYFGGYTEKILYDNMKQVVIKRAMISTAVSYTHLTLP